MKSFLAILSLFLFVGLAQAQNIEYEVIRTQEAPGYFALRVYPGNQLPPLAVETIFVENYHNRAERKRYADLAQAITNSGTRVLTSQKAVTYANNHRYRLVLLGGPAQNKWLQFQTPIGTEVMAEFERFSRTKMGPIYLMNLDADFGGNVSQVSPDKIPFLDDRSTYFVGQFDRAMKTRVSLSGETDDLIVQANGIVDLENFRPHQASSVLEALWNDLNPVTKSFSWKGLVTDSFPVLLLILGLVIMYLAGRPSRLRTGMIDEIDDKFWNTPIEETPLYAAWEKGFYWEFSDTELQVFAH